MIPTFLKEPPNFQREDGSVMWKYLILYTCGLGLAVYYSILALSLILGLDVDV